MPVRLTFALLLAAAATAPLAKAEDPPNPLFVELTTEGVALPGDQRKPAPAPSLPDGLDAKAQLAKITNFAKRFLRDDLFFGKSVTAPIVVEITDLGDGAKQIDVWFVAHGDLDTIVDKKLFDNLMVATKPVAAHIPEGARVLTDKELEARGLTPRELAEGVREEYGLVEMSVIERVHVTGISYTVSSRTKDSLMLAMQLADELAEDTVFPGRWRPITRDSKDKLQLGAPQPYQSFGGYVKATRLVKPSGALLVECHLIYDEPKGWFKGKNMLEPKVPALVQDRVRKFRRELKPDEQPKKPAQ